MLSRVRSRMVADPSVSLLCPVFVPRIWNHMSGYPALEARHAGNESCVDLGPCIDLARAYALRGPMLTAAPRCASSHRACHHAGHRVYAAIITLHLSIPGKPVLRFQKNKLSYRFCDELACLIAQQVDDYRHHKIPKYYGEKGYFNTIDFKWCTKRMSSFDDNKVKG